MAHGRKEITIACGDYFDGTNTVDRASDVGKRYRSRGPKKQCTESLNFTLNNMKSRVAIAGLNSAIAGRQQGLDFYLKHDGTEYLLTVVDGELFSVNQATGALTSLYDLTGTGEAWFDDWLDKNFVCNGSAVVKIEGTVAYQVGISPPTGVTAVKAAGGTLEDGTYKLYAGYARVVGGLNVLFSTGQQILPDVELGGGDNSILIENFANSDDPQVGNKVIWMTDANDVVYFLYYETGDNTTTSFTISDSSGKTADIYSVVAQFNVVPPPFEHLILFEKRLYGSIGNRVYYSLQEGNVYDLERFDTNLEVEGEQYIDYPFNCEGFVSVGDHLYINTPGGMIRQPEGDPGAEYKLVEPNKKKRLYFKYFRTVDNWSDSVIGLTQDGVRIFDGRRFTPYDLSRDIKPDIKRLYDSYGTENRPCGVVTTQNNRTEYRLYYKDNSISNAMNNRCARLNLDRLQLFDNGANTAWDFHDDSANYVTVNQAGVAFGAQSHPTKSVIWKESPNRIIDLNVYKKDIFSAQSVVEKFLRSGTFIPDLAATCKWNIIRVMAAYNAEYTIAVVQTDNTSNVITAPFTPTAEGGFILNISQLGVGKLAPNTPKPLKGKINRKVKGKGVYVEIRQVKEDQVFELLELAIYGIIKRTRRT